MGSLSLSNFSIGIKIKKAEFSGCKAYKIISKVRKYPKFNLDQLLCILTDVANRMTNRKTDEQFSGDWV